jgi:hypothetical protein
VLVVGGIYSPNHQSGHWEGLLSNGAPILSGAPATSPNRWGSTVGALTSGATGQSGGAPDSHSSQSGAPSGACSDSARVVAHCSLLLLQTTVSAVAVAPPGTPNSPVLHRTVR